MENDVKDWLSGVTGIEFSSNVDMFSARYDYTDYLLCHDDELEGRRIAFIWYLVPQSWSKQDGGALDLFSMDTETGQPTEVSRSLVPSRNSFVFFEVTPKSFHQVAEVLTRDKTRLSIGGWFHGKSVERPDKIIEPRVSPDTPVDIDEDSFFDWINPLYLDPGNQAEIQENFEANSEISLQDFLTGEKYSEIGEALKSSDLKWTQRGPPNKQHYRVVAGQEMPEVVKECVQFLKSDAMFLFLSNLTGLKLHALAPCDDDDEEDEDKEESGEDGEESSENDNGEKDFQKEKSPVPSSSQDTDDDETKRKKLKEKEESKKSAKQKKKKPFDPRCLSEVRRWEHGSYTMVRDDDPEQAEFALDARLFFNCKDWSLEVGGYTSYVARDEDEELLTAQPEENSLILVYRDNKTMKFVKRITDEINRMPETSFHDIAVTYYE